MKIAIVLVTASLVVGDRPQAIPIDCAAIRKLVDAHGEEAVIAAARARGISEQAIAEAARRCLRR